MRASQTPTQSSQDVKRRRTTKRKPSQLVKFSKGLPLQLKATLKYAEYAVLTMSGSGKSSYIFSCNNLFDPNVTGTGHQPHYFDQYMGLYDHYRVSSSRIKVSFYNHTTFTPTPATAGCAIALFIDDDATVSLSNQFDEYEREGSINTIVTSNLVSPRILRKKWNAKTAFGVKANGDAMEGTNGASPTEQQYFIIAVQAEPTDIVTVLVELEYDSTFTEQRTVGSS